MNNIHVILVTYALDVTPLIESLGGEDVVWHIFTHSRRPEIIGGINLLFDGNKIRLMDYGTNRGLARSWNDGLAAARAMNADVTIIANDDITASRGDLLLLAAAARANRDYGIIEAQGYEGGMGQRQLMNFGFCAINPILLDKVGYFDPNFAPLYFEDADISRRAALIGVPMLDAGESGVVHFGSSAIRSSPELAAQNLITFQANHRYYRAKHGGSPGEETFATPFNDPALSWVIPEDTRNSPYPGHDRTDLAEIVKL